MHHRPIPSVIMIKCELILDRLGNDPWLNPYCSLYIALVDLGKTRVIQHFIERKFCEKQASSSSNCGRWVLNLIKS